MGNSPSQFRVRDHPLDMRQRVFDGTPSFAALAQKLQAGAYKNVIVLTGAGISVAAGVPDFRSPGTGLYDNLAKYNLPHPTAVFDLDFFRRDPRPFFRLARELYPTSILPTTAHYFIRQMADKGYLRRVYTQNIDMLDRLAGVPASLLVEAHGSFATSTCTQCAKRYNTWWFESWLFTRQGQEVPKCDVCGSVVKPDIVFFGERLPDRFGRLVGPDMSAADLLIVIGTSLQVHPVAGLPAMVGAYVPRMLINREVVGECEPPLIASTPTLSPQAPRRDRCGTGGTTGFDSALPDDAEGEALAEAVRTRLELNDADGATPDAAWQIDDDDDDDVVGRGGSSWGFRFAHEDNYRDVLLQGDIEDNIKAFADALGWGAELSELKARGDAEILAARLPAELGASDSILSALGVAQADAVLAGSPVPEGRVNMAPRPVTIANTELLSDEHEAIFDIEASMSISGILAAAEIRDAETQSDMVATARPDAVSNVRAPAVSQGYSVLEDAYQALEGNVGEERSSS